MADLASSPYFLLILFIAAFALPLVYLVWIRNSPRYGREPWPTVLKTFAWGAVFSVIIAIILSVVFILRLGQIQSLNDFFARRFQDTTSAFWALVVAPVGRLPILHRRRGDACDVQPFLDPSRRRGPAEQYGRRCGRLSRRREPRDYSNLGRAAETRHASVVRLALGRIPSARNFI